MKCKNEYKPLRGKIHGHQTEDIPRVFDVDDVASAVMFYKKYRRWREFKKDNPKEWDVYIKWQKENVPLSVRWRNHNDFNRWFFDYCFGDVTEK